MLKPFDHDAGRPGRSDVWGNDLRPVSVSLEAWRNDDLPELAATHVGVTPDDCSPRAREVVSVWLRSGGDFQWAGFEQVDGGDGAVVLSDVGAQPSGGGAVRAVAEQFVCCGADGVGAC